MASINKGDNTGAFGNDFLRIYLNNPNNLYIQKAVIQINDNLSKEYYDPIFPLRVNFTGSETEALEQVNTCRLALWDELGRRRTAEGKFTFFTKENKITDPDAPTGEDYTEYPEDNSVTFDLTDAEFACQFIVNATPSKLSDLQIDVPILTPETIEGGKNITTRVKDNKIIIDADIDNVTSYNDLTDIPTLNGNPLIGDIEIDVEHVNADWNATSGKAKILNKPSFPLVAYSGNYNDLNSKPKIPKKLSELENDLNILTDSVLDNYYNKTETISLIDNKIEPISNQITDLSSKEETDIENLTTLLNNKMDNTDFSETINELRAKDNTLQTSIRNNTTQINALNAQLPLIAYKTELSYLSNNIVSNYATKIELQSSISDFVTLEDLETALNTKLDKTDLGNGLISIYANNSKVGGYLANSKENVNITIPIPTKVSDLENDRNFVTAEEISLDNIVTKQNLNDALSIKASRSEIGRGSLTLKVNGDILDTIGANTNEDKIVNLSIPTKLSQLENDGFATNNNLEDLNEDINEISSNVSAVQTRLNNLVTQIDRKVDYRAGYSLVSNTNIAKLETLKNYNDTELRTQVENLSTKVDNIEISADVTNKVDKEEGKGLSSNDFTTEYKDKIDNNYGRINTLSNSVSSLDSTMSNMSLSVENLENDITNVERELSNEETLRTLADSSLQEQLNSIQDKPKLVAVLNGQEEFENYIDYTQNADTLNGLVNGDLICKVTNTISENEVINSVVTYYTWNKENKQFNLKVKEGESYTKAAADKRFISNDFSINGYSVKNGDINLTANDIGAIPNTETINAGKLYILRNGTPVYEDGFSANSSEDVYMNIVVPTDLADLKNEQEFFITQADLKTEYLGNAPEESGQTTLVWDKIEVIETKINALEGNLPTVALTGSYKDLFDKVTKISTLKNDQTNPDSLNYIDNVFVTDLKTVTDFATSTEVQETMQNFVADYALKSEIPTAVSQLENDRGYVITSAIGKGNLNLYLNEELIGTFNSNSKDDVSINLPIDNVLSATSLNPVQNKVIKTQLDLKAIDSNVVHLTGNETIYGTKTFSDLISTTQNNSDNSTKVATTAFVKNQGFAVDNNVVHKTQNETIAGNKTFTGTTKLSEATGITPNISDDSNKLATTAFVKNQGFALNANVIHDGGDETINGNKTFAETTTFQGITNLGDYAHVSTPDGNTQDAVANVQYVLRQLQSQTLSVGQLLGDYYTSSESDSRYLRNIPTHTHDADDITLNDYVKGSISGNIYSTDTIGQALAKIENNLDAINTALQLLELRVQDLENRQ